MMTVATVAFCIGMLLVAGAGIFVLLILGDLRALWTLRRLHPTAIGGRGRVALEGTVEYGTAGRQIAPVTGEDCAWYRVTLLREPARYTPSGESGPDYDRVLEVESPAWPTLADRTGRIPVDPRLVSPSRVLFDPLMTGSPAYVVTAVEHSRARPVPLPPVVPPDVADDLRPSERLHLTEVRVARGQQIFAVGRAGRRGLTPSRTGLTVFTPRSRAEVIAVHREDIRVGRTAVVWLMLIGLFLAVPAAVHLL
ncbi:hypothetical protein AB0G04_35780 [Actinoplanes sp. NPDC023801]|uniref:hypothetical protein n=1 Tax=Actinoplanes sp. NPDC023801 TaxID=3154595 RepID=UPI0033D5622A